MGEAVFNRASSNVAPRFRIPRRVVVVGVVVLLLAIVRLIWGTYEAAQLHREVKRLRDQGQPLAAEDFAYVSLPDDQNAAKFLMDAAGPSVIGAVIYYGSSDPARIRTDLPIYFARAGLDSSELGSSFELPARPSSTPT